MVVGSWWVSIAKSLLTFRTRTEQYWLVKARGFRVGGFVGHGTSCAAG